MSCYCSLQALCKATIVAVLLLSPSVLLAQNVSINNNGAAPNTNAILDVDVTTNNKGVLIPRLSTAQRTGIGGLGATEDGLLVYDETTNSFWYWDGTQWVEILNSLSPDGDWTVNGNDQYSAVSGNVGIGTAAPAYKLHVDGTAAGTSLALVDQAGTTAGSHAVKGDGAFGPTTGYLGVQGNTNFDGTGIGINGLEIGVVGISTGGSATDNYGLFGYSNGAGAYGQSTSATDFGVEGFNSNASGTGIIATGNNIGGNYLTAGSGVAASGTVVGAYGTATAAGGTGVYGSVSTATGFGVFGNNDDASGTGVVGSGNNQLGSYLISGSGGAFTGTGFGVVAWGTTAASGTGLSASGNGVGINALLVGSGVAGSGTEVGVYGYANSATGAGVLGQNNNAAGWAGDFQGITKVGTSTANVHEFWGYWQSATNSDFHRVVPNGDNWGYVGFSGRDWWRGYSVSWVTTSNREEKRNIQYLADADYDVLMNDIENMPLAYYKFKCEDDNFTEGNEAKYAPVMHLGTFTDEAPDYVQDNTFSGISIYEYSSLAMAGVKHNRNSIKKMESKISDFGVESVEGGEVWVGFTGDFAHQLINAGTPVVTATAMNTEATLYISEVTSEGFKVKTSAASPVAFSWIAMAKVEQAQEQTSYAEYKTSKQLVAPSGAKQQMKGWAKADNDRVDAITSQRSDEGKVTPSKEQPVKARVNAKSFETKSVEHGKESNEK